MATSLHHVRETLRDISYLLLESHSLTSDWQWVMDLGKVTSSQQETSSSSRLTRSPN